MKPNLPEKVPEIVETLRNYGEEEDFYVQAEDIAEDMDMKKAKATKSLKKVTEAYSEIYDEGSIDDELEDLRDKLDENVVPRGKSMIFGNTMPSKYMTSVFRSDEIYEKILEITEELKSKD